MCSLAASVDRRVWNSLKTDLVLDTLEQVLNTRTGTTVIAAVRTKKKSGPVP